MVTRAEVPSIDETRSKVLNDIKRGKIRAGVARPNVAPGSESYIKAEAWSASALRMHANIASLQDATMADAAEGEDLERLANVLRGMKKSNGAGATGFVKVSVSGTVIFAEGQEGTTDDGLRYKVVVTTQVSNGEKVPIQGVDVGKQTDKASGTTITWTSPPGGSAATAVVDDAGLTDGKDPDDDASLRKRLLDALQHPAQSGSWADVAGWAEESSRSVEKAFVYPAIEGPSTLHAAITVEATEDNYYSRQASAALVNVAANAIVADMPSQVDVTTTACTDENTNVVLQLTLPAHPIDGGTGGGWVDAASVRWPAVGGSPFATYLSAAPISGTRIRVETYTEPVDDAYIAIWSNSRKEFQHTRIKSHSLVSGSVYELVLWTAIDTNKIASGDYVSPDAEKLDDYGTLLASTFGTLGPGEKTSDSSLLPRSYRHPLNLESWGYQFTSRHIGQLSASHNEIDHVSVSTPSLPASPTVAVAVTNNPNILVLGNLGIYPA